MDENTSAVTGAEAEAEAQTESIAEQDDWDDIDLSDVSDNSEDEGRTDEEAEGADQQPEEQAEGQTDTEEEAEAKEAQGEADQLFTLKHLDSTYQVDKNQVVALAQKGLDYDRIRARADQEISRLTVYENFLKELAAPNNMSIDDLMDTTRANILAEREGLDRDTALQRVKLDRDRQALEAQKQSMNRQSEAGVMEAQRQARMKQSMDRFIQSHPDLNAKDIPETVWQDFAAGKDLSDAYAIHEARQLREKLEAANRELETLKQNKSNQARTTGSQTDAGAKQETDQDWFDRQWYDGT